MTEPEIITFGCRLNAYESEVMRAHADAAGLGRAIIVNTCAVTGEAVRQARQRIRKARRGNPDAPIIVTGCAAQVDPEMFARMPEVDHVLGNEEKLQAASFAALVDPDGERVRVGDIMAVREAAGSFIDGFGSRARAYVQIQTGCDHRCTFCIIPMGRGNSRSVPAADIREQIARLIGRGYREVVLTGVDLTAYGADLEGGFSLGELVLYILGRCPDLARLRLSSIDQIEVDDALMEAIATEPRLMPHLHLSLQAGDDMILKRMKRRHGRADAIRFCEQVRTVRPEIVFGADLIAGFPTETEAMFERTLDLVGACGLTYLHVFPYSPRPGTPGARMPQVDSETVKARARRLRELGRQQISKYLDAQAGQTCEVLVERARCGRTPQFAEVSLDKDCVPGDLVAVKIAGLAADQLLGEVRT